MQTIRREIAIVIVLLIAAFAVSSLIYVRGGFSFATNNTEVAYCGNTNPVADTTHSYVQGRQLFQANCSSCHAMETVLVGPALMGVKGRVPSDTFIQSLLLEPQKTLKTSKYAKQLYKQYDSMVHMSFKNILTKEDIRTIVDYCTPYEHALNY